MRAWQQRKKWHYLRFLDQPACHIRNGQMTKLTRKKEEVSCKNCLYIINGWPEVNGRKYKEVVKKEIRGLIKFMGWNKPLKKGLGGES